MTCPPKYLTSGLENRSLLDSYFFSYYHFNCQLYGAPKLSGGRKFNAGQPESSRSLITSAFLFRKRQILADVLTSFSVISVAVPNNHVIFVVSKGW